MARKTKQNKLTSPELIAQYHKQNVYLITSFLDYLRSTDKSKGTIEQYHNDLDIFFCWNVKTNNNKPFTQVTKKDFTRFQGTALSEWEWSSNRLRREKSAISSLSDYIENILDEEEEFANFRSTIKKIANPVNVPVREKTVFKEEELKRLLDILVEDKQYEQACALSLAMSSARRKSELTRFKVSWFKDEYVIADRFYKTPERVVTKGQGSKGKLLNLYIIKEMFDPYFKLWLEDRQQKGIQSEWLFPSPRDPENHISSDVLDTYADRFTELCGKDFYWHSIRHFAVTQFVKNRFPPQLIQGIIGWNSAEMIDTYNDLTTDDLIEDYFKNKEDKS